jgi:hypothetical protein
MADNLSKGGVTHEDVRVLLPEYKSLTKLHESMVFLAQVSGEIVVT